MSMKKIKILYIYKYKLYGKMYYRDKITFYSKYEF
jgi:hypothetical protein